MEQEKLLENCNLEEVLSNDSFVGIYYNKGKFDIKFPLGYRLGKEPLKDDVLATKQFELQQRRDILLLIQVLSHFKNTLISPKEITDTLDNENQFPLYAYMQVYKYYKKNGYYIPKENIYKKVIQVKSIGTGLLNK